MTVTVWYQRDAVSLEIPATIGRSIFTETDAFGVVSRVISRDFLISTADLFLAGEPIIPKRGDHIIENSNGHSYTFEVLAPGNRPHWRWSDPYRRTLRIHTKLITEETS